MIGMDKKVHERAGKKYKEGKNKGCVDKDELNPGF